MHDCATDFVEKQTHECGHVKSMSKMQAGGTVHTYIYLSPLWSKVYVGATGFQRPRNVLDRWWEHVRLCRLWQSESSKRRCAHRIPPLYHAMAAVGCHNVAIVVLQTLNVGGTELAKCERFYIRKFSPTFNASGTEEASQQPIPASVLGSWWADDISTTAARILRKSHPRLTDSQWVALVCSLREAGERALATKVARMARLLRPKLRLLRSHPHITFPCPVPDELLHLCQRAIRTALKRLPTPLRSQTFRVLFRCTTFIWRGSPFIVDLLSPSRLPFQFLGPCSCSAMPGHPRLQWHLITKPWQVLPCCKRLTTLLGAIPLMVRSYLSTDYILKAVGLLCVAGFSVSDAEYFADLLYSILSKHISAWLNSIPRGFQLSYLKSALLDVHAAGYMFVKLDRNPSRVLLMCRQAWEVLQEKAFFTERYERTTLIASALDEEWKDTVFSTVSSLF